MSVTFVPDPVGPRVKVPGKLEKVGVVPKSVESSRTGLHLEGDSRGLGLPWSSRPSSSISPVDHAEGGP